MGSGRDLRAWEGPLGRVEAAMAEMGPRDRKVPRDRGVPVVGRVPEVDGFPHTGKGPPGWEGSPRPPQNSCASPQLLGDSGVRVWPHHR